MRSFPASCNPIPWKAGEVQLDLSRRGFVMGIVNVTPDSFSDGGRFLEPERAVAHGLALEAEGAAILDIGGESTRPGAAEVAVGEEIRRVIPVLRGLSRAVKPGTLLSVDTSKPEVAAAALEAGASIINDVCGLRDPAMLDLAASCDAGLVLMHMQGTPRSMQASPRYENVVDEVRSFFEERLKTCEKAGIAPERLCFDPGIGFGKSLEHNISLLRALGALRIEDRPLLLGVSRKSFIGNILDESDPSAREWPTVALTALARESGAEIVRVHSVRPNLEALRMAEAIQFGIS